VSRIQAVLSAITPPAARLAALEWMGRLPVLAVPEHQSILRMLPDPKSRGEIWSAHDKDDLARLAIERVHACTFLDRTFEARATLIWAAKRFESPQRPLFDRFVRRAEARLGIRRDTKRSAIERWRKSLIGTHPDFLAGLLLDDALVQRTPANAERLRGEALQYAQSSEVKTWIRARSFVPEPEPVAADISWRPNEVVIRIDISEITQITTRTAEGAWTTIVTEDFFERFLDAGELLSYSALKYLATDPSGFMRRMRDAVVDHRLAMLLRSGPRVHVRLELGENAWQSLPWELAFGEMNVASVYRALGSKRIVRPGRRPPQEMSVLVVRRSERTGLVIQRGSVPDPIESSYQRYWRDIAVLQDPTIDELLSVATRRRPDFIHVSASFGETPESGAVVEFANRDLEVRTAAPSSFPANVFARIAAADYGEEKPVILLEATAPPHATETVRQLMLRNVFAAELARSGEFGAVIATGLFEGRDGAVLYRDIAHALQDGVRYGELVKRLSVTSRRSFTPSAFFCDSAETDE
jgi:hypothetical protein